jgi:hypothetical protein
LARELERPGYCGERRGCFLAAVSAVIFWVSKIGSSPTSRLQRTAQAGFLLRWGQFGVGLARENAVKWGHAAGEVVLGVGLVFGQHLHGPPLKRSVGLFRRKGGKGKRSGRFFVVFSVSPQSGRCRVCPAAGFSVSRESWPGVGFFRAAGF